VVKNQLIPCFFLSFFGQVLNGLQLNVNKMKIKVMIVSFLFTLFGILGSVNAQVMGNPGGKIYDNRLCSVKPGENKGTECRIENPEGLCLEYSTCP